MAGIRIKGNSKIIQDDLEGHIVLGDFLAMVAMQMGYDVSVETKGEYIGTPGGGLHYTGVSKRYTVSKSMGEFVPGIAVGRE